MPTTTNRRHLLRGGLWLALAAVAGWGGIWSAAQQAPPSQVPAVVLRVTTSLILVDVVVTDKDGSAVTDLNREDFTLLEEGRPQEIATFSLEDPTRRARERPQPPPLPPNVYTNRPQYRMPPGPLTILLLDLLNTPQRDQVYAREQMLSYLATQLRPGLPLSVLALGNDLWVLQNFTSDPELLRAALEQLAPQRSVAIEHAQPVQIPPEIAGFISPKVWEALERWNFDSLAQSTDERVRITLAALGAIARAAAGYPGRKNLIWLSGAFPITLSPDNPRDMDLFRSYAGDMRRAAALLTDAQVAVYPVDARGLVGLSEADMRHPNRTTVPLLERPGAVIDEDRLIRTARHVQISQDTMYQLAKDTGGRAFTNRNDIDSAVALSVADGSTYFALGYYPKNKEWDGKFRRIKVKVARKGVQVRHRRGYYAIHPTELLGEPDEEEEEDTEAARVNAKKHQLLTALSEPLPATAVTFRAHLPPPAPQAAVVVEFLVDAYTLAFEQVEEGRQHCNLDFLVAAFSPDGKVVASSSRTVNARLKSESYARVRQKGLPFRMNLELGPGRYQLRLLVRDNRSGLLGAVDLPLLLEKP